MVNTTADENEETENLTCGANCRFARSGNLLPCCKYQGNRKQLGIARSSWADCTWKHRQLVFPEEEQEKGVMIWALSSMNRKFIPVTYAESSGRWGRCMNLRTAG